MDDLHAVFCRFNELGDHEKQNLYLRGCISKTDPKKIRRRPRNNTAKLRSSHRYSISTGTKTIKVCKKAFLSIHGIPGGRLQRKVLRFDTSLFDGRGLNDNPHRTSKETLARIRSHIEQFPARESHYSRSHNVHKKYLDASLTVSKMHQMFIEGNPDLKNKVKYWLYYRIFTEEYNISFGFPRSDVCDKCEYYMAKIKASEAEGNNDETAKLQALHEEHIIAADQFNIQLKAAKHAGQHQKNIAVIAMDYQKNLPLPKTGVCQEFYRRQLWIHNFCTTDCISNQSTMYLYAEHFAGKGPNEVISCLDDCLNNMSPEIEKVHILCDNCYSQNKNKYLIAFLMSKVDTSTHITEIEVHYPIPGHSQMPCDRDFGRIEKNKLKHDRVAKPSEWVSVIRSTNVKHPFKIRYVQHPLTDNMQDDGTPVVPVRHFKAALDPCIRPVARISQQRGLLFKRGFNPQSRSTMTGDCISQVQVLKRGVSRISVRSALSEAKPAYAEFLPVKMAKANDVQTLLGYVYLEPEVTFYQSVKGAQNAVSDEPDEVE